MENFSFFIESPNVLSLIDFKNLRNLYLPLVGPTSIVLYEYLCDLSEEKSRKVFNFSLILERFSIDTINLDHSLSKLEAVGLIKTFKNDSKNSVIFNLNKPFDIEIFHKNPLLKSHLIKVIGINEYEKIYFSQKLKFLNKSDYKDTSKKYQDVFPAIFEENITHFDDGYTTMDLVVDCFENHEDNILKLPSTHFVKYLMKRNVSFYERQMINSMLKMGFSDASINLLIDFSFKFNKAIVCQYIIKIAEDFLFRSIVEFSDVRHEISIVESLKTKKTLANTSKSFKNELFNSVNINDDSISTTKELSINEIFSDEDIKGIF